MRSGPFWAPARAHALAAATLWGLPVFPLGRSKLPAIRSAHPDQDSTCTGGCGQLGHGVYDASSYPPNVKTMFAAAPWAAGYGIACGRAPHHLFGLDLDRKNGVDGIVTFTRLAREHGFELPRTAVITTHSGGLHVWLTGPAGLHIGNTVGQLGEGIDGRSSGGYLVGPGSMGPRGRYAFAPGSGPDPIAAAPPQLLALLTEPRQRVQAPAARPWNRSDSGRRLDALVQVVLDCGPNDLNNRLYWAARRAFTDPGIDPDTATARLLAAAVDREHPEVGAARTIASGRRGALRETAR
jgi:hypothetical protein